MMNLMELGILPRKLLKIRPPMCACCKIGAMTKQPRRVKGGKYKNMRKANAPGECVSMDQIESITPGFIGILRGFINKKRYMCAKFFVDHYSGFTYVKLQTSTNMDETLKAKAAFEAYARSLGVKIRHYHADNGRFTDKGFKTAIKDAY